jgi:hypothetical protein
MNDDPTADNRIEQRRTLLEFYGPLLKANELQRLLKFQSPTAFKDWLDRQQDPIRLLQLPHRRGWFAMTTEVADWLSRNGVISADPKNGGRRNVKRG